MGQLLVLLLFFITVPLCSWWVSIKYLTKLNRQKLLSKTIFKNYVLSKTIHSQNKNLKILSKILSKNIIKTNPPPQKKKKKKSNHWLEFLGQRSSACPTKKAASFKKSLVKDLVYVCPLFSPCCQYDMCVFSWILGRLIAFLFELNSSLFRPLPSIELSSHTPSSGVFLGTPLSYLQFENCWFCKRLYCCVKSWRHHHVKEDS